MIALVKLKEAIPTAAAALKQLPAEDFAYIREGCTNAVALDGLEFHLAESVAYVLATEGSLMRAQLGFMAMRSVGASRGDARRFGVAVELFHTASLLFDDMPMMDDATYRRGRLCAHRKFSDADTTLAALALITQAYDNLFRLMLNRPVDCAETARSIMTQCLGAKGILSGQSADIHFNGQHADRQDVLDVAMGKTGTLLRLLLVFPARLHGATPKAVERLERLAQNWGCAYQVLDDIKDSVGTEHSTGKTVRRDVQLDRPNYLNKAGARDAWAFLVARLEESGDLLRELIAENENWAGLYNLQSALVGRGLKFKGHPAATSAGAAWETQDVGFHAE